MAQVSYLLIFTVILILENPLYALITAELTELVLCQPYLEVAVAPVPLVFSQFLSVGVRYLSLERTSLYQNRYITSSIADSRTE